MIVRVVKFFNGDIVKFIGDALIITWCFDQSDDDHIHRLSAVNLALACAVSLVEQTGKSAGISHDSNENVVKGILRSHIQGGNDAV
jgi:hypothetical protein